MALGNFGVRAEPTLERVVAEPGQQRVVLGLRDARGVRGQLGGERYRVQRRVQPRRPKIPIDCRVRPGGQGSTRCTVETR